MNVTLADLDFLQQERGIRLLQELSQTDLSPHNSITLISRLRKTYSADEVSAALTMARLRQKAVEKFGVQAAQMFFSEDALQQASDPQIRAWRAPLAQQHTLLDVCCGIGSDSLAFAQAGASVLGLDIDPVRIAMARYNATAAGLSARFDVQDITAGIPADFDWIFFDPARRDEQGKRIYHVDSYIPPLDTIRSWYAPRMMVKLSPGVQVEQVGEYGGCLEFISVGGDLKEAVLHLGSGERGLRATLLQDGAVWQWQPSAEQPEIELADPAGWLCEPDPALLRAGLVGEVAAAFSGTLLDETIAYFCSPSAPDSPWLRAWKIRDWMPFQAKRLRAYLRERGIGRVTVKKRGSAITPEELISMLRLKGDQSCTLVLTRLRDNPVVIICDDIR